MLEQVIGKIEHRQLRMFLSIEGLNNIANQIKS